MRMEQLFRPNTPNLQTDCEKRYAAEEGAGANGFFRWFSFPYGNSAHFVGP
jgi:hypothetical protein